MKKVMNVLPARSAPSIASCLTGLTPSWPPPSTSASASVSFATAASV
ncbi:MAG: hypothetical protein WD628_07130 [Thermomicrobiales bacterium]